MKIRIRKTVALLLPALFLTVGLAFAQIEFGTISGNAEKGKELYYQHGCYGCHGYSGIGKRNLANDVSGLMSTEQLFLVYLRARGDQNPMLPTQRMPNYSEQVLPDDEALDIYAYIRSFKDLPPEVGAIPPLRTILEGAKERAGQE